MTINSIHTQASMTGDDWLSDGDRKRQAKAEVARKKAAQACSKKLEAAADSLCEFMFACTECGDGSRDRGADDSRRLLQASMREYATYLDQAYNKDRN